MPRTQSEQARTSEPLAPPSLRGRARALGRALLGLALLAAPPSLAAQAQGTVTGTVTSAASGRPLAGATVRAGGGATGAVTRADGGFRLSLPAGTHQLRVSLVGYAAGEASVTLAAGETVTRSFALEESVIDVAPLVVVGSRREDRTVTNAPVPVDVLTAEVIEQSGLTETSQIIQMLAPSFNFPRPSISDGTDHVRPATLRGLAPDQVLVLLNGKRRHTSALVNLNGTIGRGATAVDLNAIPASAIDRIEILRDGAAAQYGSDAIAGVINIILKSGPQQELSTTAGQTAEGDGRVLQAALNYGNGIGEAGFFTLSGELRDRDATNRARVDSRPQYFAGDPRNGEPARVTHRWGDAATTDAGVFLNGALPVGRAEGYLFGGVSFREGEAGGFFRRPLDDRTVRAIYPNGFLPLIGSEIWDGSAALGVRGELRGWRWDLSEVLGRNSFRFDVNNSVNVSMGTSSPTDFYAGTLKFQQATTNLDLRRDLDVGLATPVSIALGGEFRLDNYQIEAGDEASWRDGGVRILDGPNAGGPAALGAQVFPGFRPADEVSESRHNLAAYLDLESDLTTQLLVTVAGRVEDYSDFGSTANGKLAVRWEPVGGYALRGAVNTGFRAPSLSQQYFSSTSTNFINVGGVNTPFDIRTFPVNSPEGQVLGAAPLKAEKSLNLSAGLAVNPASNFSVTFDYYHIAIDDRVVLSGNFIGTDIRTLLEQRGFRGLNGGRYFTNAIDTRTDGVDVVANYGARLPWAALLRLTGGYNHTRTEVSRISATPPQLGNRQEVLFDRVERARIEVGQPRNSASLAANYSQGGFAANLSNRYYGSVTAFQADTTRRADGSCCRADQTFDGKVITDLDLSYRLRGGITAAIGANNLFDVYPDEVLEINSTSGNLPYSGISPWGFNGAYYYVRLSFQPLRR